MTGLCEIRDAAKAALKSSCQLTNPAFTISGLSCAVLGSMFCSSEMPMTGGTGIGRVARFADRVISGSGGLFAESFAEGMGTEPSITEDAGDSIKLLVISRQGADLSEGAATFGGMLITGGGGTASVPFNSFFNGSSIASLLISRRSTGFARLASSAELLGELDTFFD